MGDPTVMATPLAILNLIHGGWRTVLSLVGISIAIVLIFMQLGFLGAVTDTAVVFYDKMKFDLIACSPDYYNFVDCGKFPAEHLARIQSADSVQAVVPLHVSLGKWNYEAEQVQRGMLILGVDPSQETFVDPALNSKLSRLNDRKSILVDASSRPRFLGADNTQPFGKQHLGLQVELNGVASKVAGLFEIGTGLASDGATMVHQEQFFQIVPGYSSREVSLALIQLRPGSDPQVAQAKINELFAAYLVSPVDVKTRSELEVRETAYWQRGTPIGFIFTAGALVAFCVGGIIVYIVLSADITKQLGEYATLKAMGYRDFYLSRTVLEQAFILAVISYAAGLLVSLVLYDVVGNLAKLPITMNAGRMAIVFASSLLMSFLSALIAIQKLRQADPADLF